VVDDKWQRAEEEWMEWEAAEQEAEFKQHKAELLQALGTGEIDNMRFRELAEELDMDRARVESTERCHHQQIPW
jgi:hypothetical protein